MTWAEVGFCTLVCVVGSLVLSMLIGLVVAESSPRSKSR